MTAVQRLKLEEQAKAKETAEALAKFNEFEAMQDGVISLSQEEAKSFDILNAKDEVLDDEEEYH
ncbi:hypothetical protein K8T27_000907 [Campylobacter upsaliensis]|uniref:Uncharacterized protein n=1 Tax=Campylobacter upsaliensis TaxID=28080 RepID=A0A5L8U462_CAMUP|nr:MULTISPECIES: hypothetical protein [Campylobacter]EAH7072729.1 hypothetical protein [Campylobacter upsaliensis]EAH8539951.1 hypothetical protein [Campylobacter upsaliensis]EAI0016731.1 hypothetical protein [Campylobacter upsaliensis]EAI0665520.1 hypothetical protein [Campylobacter upsaliensis]EAI0687221.1 hypothetical protein [Campylobacter upsaliensis]